MFDVNLKINYYVFGMFNPYEVADDGLIDVLIYYVPTGLIYL